MNKKSVILLVTLCVAPLSVFAQERVEALCEYNGVRLYVDFAAANVGRCRIAHRRFVLDILPEDEPINPSPWYAFRLEGEGVARIELSYGSHKHRYMPKISTDKKVWTALDRRKLSRISRGARVRFSLNIEQPIWVAAQEIMDLDFYETWLQGLSQDLSDLKLTEFGRSAAGLPLWVAQTNPTAVNAILLVGRQHPPELTGALAMLAYVEELLAMEREAAAGKCEGPACTFFSDTNIVIAPLLNPDGVQRGYWRHNIGGLDLNRDWGHFSQPETQAVKRLIDEISAQSQLRLFIDFHSTRENLFYIQTDDDITRPLNFSRRWLQAARREGVYRFSIEPRGTSDQLTSKNYIYKRFGVPAIVYEVGDETRRSSVDASARVFARQMVRTLYPYK